MLNAKELKIHNELLSACSNWKTSNQAIVVTLLAVARTKLFRKLKRRNLVEYIVEELKIDSTFTFDLNRVVRSALEFPDLENALRDGSLTVSKATRILSALNPGNVRAIIAYAASHTYAETNTYLANQQPEQTTRETWKQLSANQYKISVVLTAKQFKALQRVQSLEAQKQRRSKMADAVGGSLAEYLWRHDPVEKARRATERKSKTYSVKFASAESGDVNASPGQHFKSGMNSMEDLRTDLNSNSMMMEPSANDSPKILVRTTGSHKRERFTAAQKHAVNLKTGGRCCLIGRDGKRCDCDRWVEIHHIIPVSQGGTNDVDNLIHLCGAHHDLVHQETLPLDDEKIWWKFENRGAA